MQRLDVNIGESMTSDSLPVSVHSQKGNSSKMIIIGLAVAVIILIGFAGYIEMQSQSRISSLKSQLSNANSNINYLQSELSNANLQIKNDSLLISELKSQLTNDNSTISSLKSQLSNDNSTIASLHSQLSNDNSEISSLQSQLSSANSEISSLKSQLSNASSEISSLQSIINLQDQENWVNSETVNQPADSYTYWNAYVPYAGYIIVDVQSSTTSNTYVAVSWTTANGISYYGSVQVGYSGYAEFPVLPSNNVTISVGNTNTFNGASEVVSITYVY